MENQTKSIQDILNQTNLNWKVSMEPIQTISGIPVEGTFAVVRQDINKAFPKTFSDQYQPYQNHELIELLDKVSGKTGLEIHKGGSFKGGARVFVQLKSNDLKLGTDRVEGFLTGINSFDGSTSLAFGPSNITISCMNTFFAAFKEMNTKIRHTKNMGIKVDEVCKALENVLRQEQIIFDDIKMMSETRFDRDKTVDQVIRSLFEVSKEIDLKDEKALSSRKFNQISKFYVDLNGEIAQKGDNLWGLFSGVTKYTTHSVGKGDSSEKKMFGKGIGAKDFQIFNQLVELI
jgi:hypothetical protein